MRIRKAGLAADILCVVDVEEVRVEHCLDDAGSHGDRIPELWDLVEVPIQPIGDVQRPVCAEREEVVRGNGFGLPRPLQHEELGQDRDALQPDGKGPEYFRRAVLVGEENGHDGACGEEVLDLEGVLVGIVGGLVVVEHEVDDVGRGSDEDDLEDGVVEVVELVEGPEKIEVARDVDEEVEELGFEGDARRALLL
jgi:hypothetical protein